MFAWRLSISNHICETLQSEFSQINPFICALKVLPREVMENVKIGKLKMNKNDNFYIVKLKMNKNDNFYIGKLKMNKNDNFYIGKLPPEDVGKVD